MSRLFLAGKILSLSLSFVFLHRLPFSLTVWRTCDPTNTGNPLRLPPDSLIPALTTATCCAPLTPQGVEGISSATLPPPPEVSGV
jgi:hypothetical protein